MWILQIKSATAIPKRLKFPLTGSGFLKVVLVLRFCQPCGLTCSFTGAAAPGFWAVVQAIEIAWVAISIFIEIQTLALSYLGHNCSSIGSRRTAPMAVRTPSCVVWRKPKGGRRKYTFIPAKTLQFRVGGHSTHALAVWCGQNHKWRIVFVRCHQQLPRRLMQRTGGFWLQPWP